jgi:hypothetical protein
VPFDPLKPSDYNQKVADPFDQSGFSGGRVPLIPKAKPTNRQTRQQDREGLLAGLEGLQPPVVFSDGGQPRTFGYRSELSNEKEKRKEVSQRGKIPDALDGATPSTESAVGKIETFDRKITILDKALTDASSSIANDIGKDWVRKQLDSDHFDYKTPRAAGLPGVDHNLPILEERPTTGGIPLDEIGPAEKELPDLRPPTTKKVSSVSLPPAGPTWWTKPSGRPLEYDVPTNWDKRDKSRKTKIPMPDTFDERYTSPIPAPPTFNNTDSEAAGNFLDKWPPMDLPTRSIDSDPNVILESVETNQKTLLSLLGTGAYSGDALPPPGQGGREMMPLDEWMEPVITSIGAEAEDAIISAKERAIGSGGANFHDLFIELDKSIKDAHDRENSDSVIPDSQAAPIPAEVAPTLPGRGPAAEPTGPQSLFQPLFEEIKNGVNIKPEAFAPVTDQLMTTTELLNKLGDGWDKYTADLTNLAYDHGITGDLSVSIDTSVIEKHLGPALTIRLQKLLTTPIILETLYQGLKGKFNMNDIKN